MGFSVLRIWPVFDPSSFSVFPLKTVVFRFWCLVRFAGFLSLVFGFCQQCMMAVFQIFLPKAFYEVTSRAKTVVPRDHIESEECMTSLVSLALSCHLGRNVRLLSRL